MAAVGGPSGEAVGALAAGTERREHVVPDLEVHDLGADLLHDASALVTQDARQREGEMTCLRGEVGVAHAGGDQAHEYLVRARLVEVHVFEEERRPGGVHDSGCRPGHLAPLLVGDESAKHAFGRRIESSQTARRLGSGFRSPWTTAVRSTAHSSAVSACRTCQLSMCLWPLRTRVVSRGDAVLTSSLRVSQPRSAALTWVRRSVSCPYRNVTARIVRQHMRRQSDEGAEVRT